MEVIFLKMSAKLIRILAYFLYFCSRKVKMQAMKTIYECSQSKALKWLTVIGLLIMFGGIVLEIWCLQRGMNMWLGMGVILLLVSSIVSVFVCYPQYIVVTDEGIGIHTVIHTRKILYADIKYIVRTDKDFMRWNNCIRIFGISGMMGDIGIFRQKKIGTFQAYVTDNSKAFLIIRKKGQPIAISVSEPDEFIPYYLKGGK